MTNLIVKEIANRIWEDANFQDQYTCLFLNVAQKQLTGVNSIEFEKFNDVDLNALLKKASLMVSLDDDAKVDAVLRIAHYAVERGENQHKLIGCMLLDMLVNQPAIKLAKESSYLDDNVEHHYPFGFALSSLNRFNYYHIEIGENEDFYTNKFQREFWNIVDSEEHIISISAPTSVGKSYIVTKWLKKVLDLANDSHVAVAIIVPTRALINQFENDLKKEFEDYKSIVNIESMPFPKKKHTNKLKSIYVFTQERMHVFLSRNRAFNFQAVFVDESHKIGDGERGVLLQSTIERLLNRHALCKVILAGPFIKNPQDLFNNSTPIKSNLKTVNQNFFSINSVFRKPKEWTISLLRGYDEIKIAYYETVNKLGSTAPHYAILAHHAYVIGIKSDSNLVYADGGSQAEKIADCLYDLLGEDEEFREDREILELVELCKETVHPDFLLNKLLRRGIAFHYGSIPQQIRLKVEQLFADKKIKYLICTSTLIEGVNLSCKNIFIRSPKKGSDPMANSDLFNLVGRAGRLGKEFYGNIFFVDWVDAPKQKEEIHVERTTQKALKNNFDDIVKAFETDMSKDKKMDKIEATLGFLYNHFLQLDHISLCNEVKENCTETQIISLDNALKQYQQKIVLPNEVLMKHPITYHYSMQKLLERFYEKYTDNPEEIKPVLSKDDMYVSLIKILNRMGKFFHTGLFSNDYAAHITTSWMKYKSLPNIIQRKIVYSKEHKKNKDFNTCVREVFRDIDELARYKVPKLLSCYVDVMNYFYEKIDRVDLIDVDKDISMYLEYGVDKKTYVSMILLGLSRSTIFKLADLRNMKDENILDGDLDEEESYLWLKRNIRNIKTNKLIPVLQIEEIEELIKTYE